MTSSLPGLIADRCVRKFPTQRLDAMLTLPLGVLSVYLGVLSVWAVESLATNSNKLATKRHGHVRWHYITTRHITADNRPLCDSCYME
jgi:hypothetical protein